MEKEKFCSIPDCYQPVKVRGWCQMHYSRVARTGSTDRTKVVNKGAICAAEGCKLPAKKVGYCISHYSRMCRYGHLKKRELKRPHPFYPLWFERKQCNALAPEWLDFWKFVKDIGTKPGPNFFLIRVTEGQFGPNNFQWIEKLRQRDGETKKEWWARKWQSRRKHFPLYEDDRWLRRKYGITLIQYEEIKKSQNNVCEICKKNETTYDTKTGGIRRLSVDHCHATGKVRGLLCFRCNSVIGKIEESKEMVKAILDYLTKHRKDFLDGSPRHSPHDAAAGSQ